MKKLNSLSYYDDVVTTVTMEEIPPHLILNWDQSGIKVVPSSSWTMDKRGSKRVEIIGVDYKRQITAVFVAALWVTFFQFSLFTLEKRLDVTPCLHSH